MPVTAATTEFSDADRSSLNTKNSRTCRATVASNARLYASRITGRHCDHRNPGGAVIAGHSGGSRGCAPYAMHQQSPPVGHRQPSARRYPWVFSIRPVGATIGSAVPIWVPAKTSPAVGAIRCCPSSRSRPGTELGKDSNAVMRIQKRRLARWLPRMFRRFIVPRGEPRNRIRGSISRVRISIPPPLAGKTDYAGNMGGDFANLGMGTDTGPETLAEAARYNWAFSGDGFVATNKAPLSPIQWHDRDDLSA